MRARLDVYNQAGTTLAGTLPFTEGSLQFSDELGGGGTLTFESLKSDLDALGAWDAVIKVMLTVDGTTWFNGPAYATRHTYTHLGGSRRFKHTARALLETAGSETVMLPEYVVGTMPRRAGTERGIGWMMSAYDPLDDPSEPWDRCYNTDRTSRPVDWPSGTGAHWISATGATTETESKYFRTWITITGTGSKVVEFYLSSDEQATLWVGGDPIHTTSGAGETGKKTFETAIAVMYPGVYAVGVKTETVWSKGGDGVDPVIVAAGILDADGDVSSWVVASDEDTWVACRRDNNPPGDVPPGPTPGAVLLYLLGEAQERDCSIWPAVAVDFTATEDSYGNPWDDITEQLFTVGHETYWSAFMGWGESDEVDVWMTADLVLHAAKQQGQVKAVTLTTEHLNRFTTEGTDNERGTWALARAWNGWVYTSRSGQRRESAFEVGTALSRPIARRVAKASLRDSWRWDGAGSLNPPQPGWVPYVDLRIGDRVGLDYQAVEYAERVIVSWSASAGEGGLLWDIELGEYFAPVDTS